MDDQKRYGVYLHDRTWLYEQLNAIMDDFIMGRKAPKQLNLYNMYHLARTTTDLTSEEIECMSRILICNNVKVSGINSIYGLGFDGDVITEDDGIGYMSIENNDNTIATNRIR